MSTRVEVTDAEVSAGQAAAHYVNGLIRGPAGPTEPRQPSEQRDRGCKRIERMRRFLERLASPQDGLPVVLVAGTSGKGSVAAKIAAGLKQAGYRTGLHVTPYLQTPLEKFWLDGRLARPAELAELVAWIRPAVEDAGRADSEQSPTYGMVWVALTLEYFRRAHVDALVLEVGAGGRFDLTNVVTPMLSVITSVGLDHEKSLGPSLADIAWHKAGVLRPDVPVVIGHLPDPAYLIVVDEARRVGSPITSAGTSLTDFRCVNTRIARAALNKLAERGHSRVTGSAYDTARNVALPARYERMPTDTRIEVILDGAHNPDKAAALAAVARQERPTKPLVLVIGTVRYRPPDGVLGPLLPIAHAWMATEPQVMGKPPTPAAEAAIVGGNLGLPPAAVEPNPGKAMDMALAICPPGGRVLVAGSIYLAGNLRSRWYPTVDVERQRTMWPLRHTSDEYV